MNARVDHERELADAVALRRKLHRIPETGFEVGETASRVADRLHAGGLDVETGFAGGVVATLRCGGGGRAIGLRAELDGLPIEEANDCAHRSLNAGKFHGCGHDGHMTMLIGARCGWRAGTTSRARSISSSSPTRKTAAARRQ